MRLKFHHGRWWLGADRLTEREVIILFAVMGQRNVTTSALIEMVWPDADIEPDYAEDCIRIAIMHLKEKMRVAGWTIRAVNCGGSPAPWSGYYLDRLPQVVQEAA